ncbi:hypothetical protein TBR22_A12680 [Luteitalea sp. TBR-22]|uniref:DUF5060 domain-containing protein n=1 Tax=Luteitalea sp. TBR-22 TaxID=2802971 RepID=UPI001AF24EA2|nr:DUF5060 domain-containing protein [Luteitalea sp. TBR-22]BCS32063.1 hypothetical protein TBR22_A12680 [Luteitalea sp. TBR-22]
MDWRLWSTTLLAALAIGAPQAPRVRAPLGGAEITGELRQWHTVTLTLDGPRADERDSDPNPFRDYRMTVRFTHESGAPVYNVPGYFAADGNAANTSATAGTRWRAHLSPDKPGRWEWRVSFVRGTDAAIEPVAAAAATPVASVDGRSGSFLVGATDKTSPDFRARGRLQYMGSHHLRFAGTGEYFLKLGTDSPETLLAYAGFDDTTALKPAVPLHRYEPHVADWRAGDPTWKGGEGKGLIGALNYLASKGVNSVSFLTYNAGGDGDNVWPFVSRDDKWHYDVSKLDQWQVVFDHAQRRGLHLHFKLQETENDDNYRGDYRDGRPPGGVDSSAAQGPDRVVESLDGGALGPERRLYLREIVARFGHALALNWNLGEENTQSTPQQREMAAWIRSLDPYGHQIVAHTHPHGQDQIYPGLLGEQSVLTGVSLQNDWKAVHTRTRQWLDASRKAGRPWVVANDEQGDSLSGVPPDPGFEGFAGKDSRGRVVQTVDDIRRMTLWGNLMAGGAGVEYYFGYLLPENDLVAENLRSRERSWAFGRIALDFFRIHRIPFWTMTNADALVGNATGDNSKWCLARAGRLYIVYLPTGGTTTLDLREATGRFTVAWFDPRRGGPLRKGSVAMVSGGARVALGEPPDSPTEDWAIVVRH